MKLILIFPPLKNFVYETSPSIVSEEAGNYPPLGLLSLATSVIAKGEHEVKVLDSVAENFDYPQIEEYIAKEKPDIVGITLITDYLRDGVLVASIAKNVNPGIKVMVGGHHVCLFPIETVKLKEIDYVVVGDADLIINEILDRLSMNKSVDDLEGVVTKTNYETKVPKRIIVDSLDSLPIPNRELVDYKKYTSILAKGKPITTMLTSRGCPFNCPYCSGGGIKLRSVSIKRIADEIESCISLGIRDILFFDELFTLRKEKVFQICDEIINRSLKFRWHARARIDTIDIEMLKKMKKAGCRLLQFGIETGSERIQKILKRNLKLEKIMEVIKMAKEEGILTYGNFMFNSPTETIEEMHQTIEFAIESDLDYAVFGIMSVYPKTIFYQELLENKKIEEDFWKLFAENPFSYEVKSTLWPGEHNFETLDNMVQKAYYKFYVRPGYIVKSLFRDGNLSQKYIQIKSGINLAARFLKGKITQKTTMRNKPAGKF